MCYYIYELKKGIDENDRQKNYVRYGRNLGRFVRS